jgi:hypothetical protein
MLAFSGCVAAAEDNAKSSEFGQQHVDLRRAEGIWRIEARKPEGNRLAFGSKVGESRVDRRKPSRPPTLVPGEGVEP